VPPLSLLQVTPHEIVVCKPPGLPSELPRDPRADSLIIRLQAEGFADLRLVHRLDAPSCGVMIVARSSEAAAYYSNEIAERRWHKTYVAEVELTAANAQALIGEHKAYLAIDGRRARVVRSGGKPSFLTILHAARATAGRSHVLIRLHTGRFHQIRVMLAALGAPLAGDTLYGGTEGAAMYLEHVLLAARPFGSTTQLAWLAPPHRDRPSWATSLSDAIGAEQARLAHEA
jgi:23S rRNA-/tRNA-specific pseudouridylate synthase